MFYGRIIYRPLHFLHIGFDCIYIRCEIRQKYSLILLTLCFEAIHQGLYALHGSRQHIEAHICTCRSCRIVNRDRYGIADLDPRHTIRFGFIRHIRLSAYVSVDILRNIIQHSIIKVICKHIALHDIDIISATIRATSYTVILSYDYFVNVLYFVPLIINILVIPDILIVSSADRRKISILKLIFTIYQTIYSINLAYSLYYINRFQIYRNILSVYLNRIIHKTCAYRR